MFAALTEVASHIAHANAYLAYEQAAISCGLLFLAQEANEEKWYHLERAAVVACVNGVERAN